MSHIKFDTAKLAKEKGFKLPINKIKVRYFNGKKVTGRYIQGIASPTQSELFDWLMEEHNLYIDISFSDNTWYIGVGKFTIPDWSPSKEFSLDKCGREIYRGEIDWERLQKSIIKQKSVNMLSMGTKLFDKYPEILKIIYNDIKFNDEFKLNKEFK